MLWRHCMLTGFLFSAGLQGVPSYADSLMPRNLSYEIEVKEDDQAKSCNIMLLLVNLPAPEVVNFRLVATHRKTQTVTFLGFSIDVADMIFANGLPAGNRKIPLSSAAFESALFNSAGRLNGGAVADGGVLESTADSQIATAFLQSFLTGEFSITFSRSGVSGTRTYQINAPVPVEVRTRFFECISSFP